MRLSKPFIGNFPISQRFGQNLNNYYALEGLKGHQGIDFAMSIGNPVISAVNGTVVAISKDIQRGEGVSIMSSDKFEFKGQECFLITVYWHLKDQSILVNIGDKIIVGQPIGQSGNTGQSTGPHLHFSVIPVAIDGSRRALDGVNNGFKGCADPFLWLDLPDPLIKFKELQTLLNKYGAILVVDGRFGPLSQLALKEFLL